MNISKLNDFVLNSRKENYNSAFDSKNCCLKKIDRYLLIKIFLSLDDWKDVAQLKRTCKKLYVLAASDPVMNKFYWPKYFPARSTPAQGWGNNAWQEYLSFLKFKENIRNNECTKETFEPSENTKLLNKNFSYGCGLGARNYIFKDSENGTIFVDLNTGKSFPCPKISPSIQGWATGKFLLYIEEEEIKIYNSETEKTISLPEGNYFSNMETLIVNKKDESSFATLKEETDEIVAINVWDMKSGACLHSSRKTYESLDECSFMGDYILLFNRKKDNSIEKAIAINTITGNEFDINNKEIFDENNKNYTEDFHVIYKNFILGRVNNQIHVWDIEKKCLAHCMKPENEKNIVSWTVEHNLLLISNEEGSRVWEIETGQLLYRCGFSFTSKIQSNYFCDLKDSYLISNSRQYNLSVLNTKTGDLLSLPWLTQERPHIMHSLCVLSDAISVEDPLLNSENEDSDTPSIPKYQTVILDLTTGKCLYSFEQIKFRCSPVWFNNGMVLKINKNESGVGKTEFKVINFNNKDEN